MLYILSLIMFMSGFGAGYFYMLNSNQNIKKKYKKESQDLLELQTRWCGIPFRCRDGNCSNYRRAHE